MRRGECWRSKGNRPKVYPIDRGNDGWCPNSPGPTLTDLQWDKLIPSLTILDIFIVFLECFMFCFRFWHVPTWKARRKMKGAEVWSYAEACSRGTWNEVLRSAPVNHTEVYWPFSLASARTWIQGFQRLSGLGWRKMEKVSKCFKAFALCVAGVA